MDPQLPGDPPRHFAVNVAARETRTAPLAVEELEQHGVRLGQSIPHAELVDRRRQMRDVELESKQKLWR